MIKITHLSLEALERIKLCDRYIGKAADIKCIEQDLKTAFIYERIVKIILDFAHVSDRYTFEDYFKSLSENKQKVFERSLKEAEKVRLKALIVKTENSEEW